MRHLLLPLLLLLFFCHELSAQHAETIIYNAKIYTLDEKLPQAQAVAMADGRIISVGSDKEILAKKKKQTLLINAQGKCLIPGIFDSHLHVIRGGRFYHAELRWDGVSSLKKALAMLSEQAKRTPAGQWVRVVGGWSAFQFEERRLPTLEEINEATGNVPTFILYLYGHAYINQAGLKVLQINQHTLNPNGGLIEKDTNGNPTGLLIAEPNAFLLYSTLAKLPELSYEEKINSTKSFMRELNRFGITSVMDAGGGFQNYPEDYKISNQLCEQDELTVRLPYFLFAQKAGKELEDYTRWISSVEIGEGCNDNHQQKINAFGKMKTEYHVQGAGENIVMSAADFENFDQPRPELSRNMEEEFKKVLTYLIQNKWPFRLHATYDESISRFLNVLEEINLVYPLDGIIWFFDHAETISEKNLIRIKNLNGGIAIQHRMAFQGESFIKRYGIQAAADTPPIKKMLALGIPIGMGSDGTRVSSYNPFIGLYWLTTGKTIGKTMHMGKENLLTRKEALQLYTQGSAQLIKLDKDRGKIAVGYLADLALLNKDYFTVQEDEILEIESLLTILNGKIVYGAQDFKEWDKSEIEIIPDWSPVKFFGGYQTKQ